MAKLSESDSLKLLPMPCIAITDGASCGAIGTEWSRLTVSSHGTKKVTRTATANHARMTTGDSVRIVRAIAGRRIGVVGSAGWAASWVSVTYRSWFCNNARTNGRGPVGRSIELAG